MDKTEARKEIRRLADALAAAMTAGREEYDIFFHRTEVTSLEDYGQSFSYKAIIRAVKEENF